MRIEILNTGTELLLGNTVNTHAAWFGRELFKLGLRIARQTTVPDGEAIREAIAEALGRADVLIVTGGLGPTSDDLTRETAAEVLGLELITDEAALRSMEDFFAQRGRPMAEANLKQALIPSGAEVLPNPQRHRARGLCPAAAERTARMCAVFLLPGPPRELYPMFHDEVDAAAARAGRRGNRAGRARTQIHRHRRKRFPSGHRCPTRRDPGSRIRLLRPHRRGGPAPDRPAGRARPAAARSRWKHFAPFLVSDDGSSLEATVVRLLTKSGSPWPPRRVAPAA